MGSIAILQPKDCLNKRSPRDKFIYSAMKSGRRLPNTNPKPKYDHFPKSNPNPNPYPNVNRSDRRKRSSPRRNSSNIDNTTTAAEEAPAKKLVMGQVKILKRGEGLDVLEDEKKPVKAEEVRRTVSKDVKKVDVDLVKGDDWGLSTTDRLGPEPEMLPKQMVNVPDLYAGFAFVDSPPPSSLPLPAFFTQKLDPTTDLLRLLRLNLS